MDLGRRDRRVFVAREGGMEFFVGHRVWVQREELSEVVGEAGLYFGKGDITREKFFEGGGFAISDAAGNDEIEVAEVGGDVVSEAVGGDPAANVDTNGGEFFFHGTCLDPNAGFAGDAIGGEAEIGRGADHGFFAVADLPAYNAFYIAEIEDGITDDLA